jgi:Zn-dependent peptidase ImmA (M78 family)
MNAGFLYPSEIETQTINFLKTYHPDGSIPIPIEEIIELELKIKVIPSPGLSNSGIDAFSLHDFSEIYIDEKQLFYSENRARFTLAHEIGHFVLHKQFVDSIDFDNLNDWKKFIISDLKRDPLETQANMFASFLLLPTYNLQVEFDKAKQELGEHPAYSKRKMPEDSVLAPFLAKSISKLFQVSERCAELRIRNWLNSHSK